MSNDPIGDMVTQIKNGYLARLKTVKIPYSKIKENLAEILVKVGFLESVKISLLGGNKKIKKLEITLKYQGKMPVLTNVKRISKPGLRIFARKDKLASFTKGMGVVIVSTPKGLFTHREAQKLGLGGEVICRVW